MIPFGASVRGYLGKRLDPQRSDRDFYRVDVPAGISSVRLTTTSLPNIPLCTYVFREGLEDALGMYCPGRAGRDLGIELLKLEPGRYRLAIMQDGNCYGGSAPPVHENVSDTYMLTFAASTPSDDAEEEPNDTLGSATRIAPGHAATGAFAWTRDEDWVCTTDASHKFRFVVRDAIKRPRDAGQVLEITTRGGARDGVPVRVHRGPGPMKPTAVDVVSPWTTELFPAGNEACLRLKLTPDPWGVVNAGITPLSGTEEWTVRAELGP